MPNSSRGYFAAQHRTLLPLYCKRTPHLKSLYRDTVRDHHIRGLMQHCRNPGARPAG
jgi:hypothetical protein